jgi:hypothetical protein
MLEQFTIHRIRKLYNTLLNLLQKNRGNQTPIILLSERNPMEWTKRRSQKYILVLCRIDLLLTNVINGNGNGNDNDYDFILSTTTSHFDWFSCIDQTVRAKKENLLNSNISTDMTAVTVKLDEVFTTYTDFSNTTKEWCQDELLSHISSSFETYQNKLWNIHVDYRVNMFDSSATVTLSVPVVPIIIIL